MKQRLSLLLRRLADRLHVWPPERTLAEKRTRARLAWNNWPDSGQARKVLAEYEARDDISARAWDRVVTAIEQSNDPWLSIDTAPKDGSSFLAAVLDGRNPPNVCLEIIEWNDHGRDGRWMKSDHGGEYMPDAEARATGACRPFAWQPKPVLPPPPEVA